MTWVPREGEWFVVEAVDPGDPTPSHQPGEEFTYTGYMVRLESTAPEGRVFLSSRYGDKCGLGTYCWVRPLDPAQETLWRLGLLG